MLKQVQHDEEGQFNLIDTNPRSFPVSLEPDPTSLSLSKGFPSCDDREGTGFDELSQAGFEVEPPWAIGRDADGISIATGEEYALPGGRMTGRKDKRIDTLAIATAMLLSSSPVPPGAAADAPGLPAATTPNEAVQSDAEPAEAEPIAPFQPLLPVVPLHPPERATADPNSAPAEPAPAAEEIVVVGRSRRGDPLVAINAESFAMTQAVDEAVVGPVARAYKDNLPRPVRNGLRNFLGNLREPIVAVNYLLQLRPGKAGETLGRFAINSTVGAAGLVDMAKRRPFNLPRRRNGFANTLGFYGVRPGPFFYMPLIGATTLRDLVGNGVDQVFGPLNTVAPFNQTGFVLPVATLSAVDNRAEFDEELEAIRAKRDPYAASRKYYLDRRQAEIDALRGRKQPAAAMSARAVRPR
jgi:phospholipid-binding lipoprotein MlaA